jgi:hypothetical protein
VWRHTWRKNWVNWAVLTGNSAGLKTALPSRLSHRELRSSLREPHSFLSLPADTTRASSQGTSVSSNSFSRWTSHDIFLFKYNILLQILRFFLLGWHYGRCGLQTGNDNPVFIHHSHTHKIYRTDKKKRTYLMGNLCCAREHSVLFFVQFLRS